MASIVKRGLRYSIRFRYQDRQLRATVGGSKAKAESVRLVIESTLDDLRLGRLTIPTDVDPVDFIASGGKAVPKKRVISFSEAVDLWTARRVAAETTRGGEGKHLRHLKGVFGRCDLNRLDIRYYVDRRLKFVSPVTVRKELTTLGSMLKALRLEGYAVTEIDPERIRLPVAPPRGRFASLVNARDGRRTLLTSDEVRELRSLVREQGSELVADVTDFVAFTGARRSEVCRLRASDVDLDGMTVTITEKKRRHGHVTYRVLPIHPELASVLKRRTASHVGPVFTSSINTLSAGFAKAIEGTKFDLHGLGFHTLRHSAASRLLAKNVPVTAVADVMGHADCRTTLGIYAHAFDDDSRRAVALL